MIHKLKPCPFCLEENEIQIHSDGGCKDFKVHCNKCNCTKHPSFDNDTKEGAIKSWNRRVIIED